MKNNKGFGLLGIILIIIGVLIVCGGALYFKDGGPKVPPGKNIKGNQNDILGSDSTTQKILSSDAIVSPRFGTVYPPYPKDVNSLGGGLIIDSSNNTTGYGIERVQTSEGYELWLDRVNKGNNDIKLNYTVLDSISIPSNKMSSYIYLGFCGKKDTTSLNGNIIRDYTIVVLLDADEFYSKGSAPALRVWKANLKTEKFENYSPSGISCINEEVN